MITRLALGDARGWRALRWFARLLTLLACWPAWYAFFGKVGFDVEGALVGFPGLVVGLGLWLKAGHRIRNPWKALEIDRAAGVARLREGPVAIAVSPLSALVDWSLRSFVVTTRTKHGTTQRTWYAVRCSGFGATDLYTDDHEGACKRFIHQAEAAAFPFDSTSWKFSEGVLTTLMKRHGLSDRDALLWAASRLDDGKRYLNEAELEAAAVGLSQTTVGARLGAATDRVLARFEGGAGDGVRWVLTGAAAWAVVVAVRTTEGEPSIAILVALGALAVALSWRSRRPLVALLTSLAGGAALVSKPWVAPFMHSWQGVAEPFSPTSETHFYFLIPGIGLCLTALVLAMTLRVRRT